MTLCLYSIFNGHVFVCPSLFPSCYKPVLYQNGESCHHAETTHESPGTLDLSEILVGPPPMGARNKIDGCVIVTKQGRLWFRRCLSVCLLMDWQGRLTMGRWRNDYILVAIRITSGYRDCFPDSSLLGDTESGINRAARRCTAGNARSRHSHSNYDVIMSPACDRQPRQM